MPYNKTNKLVTALYMVTDNMERDEPIRLKLRTLGTEILSDITMLKTNFDTLKIDQILSFLNISFDIGMISEMNFNILKKEFIQLKESIISLKEQNHLWFENFILNTPSSSSDLSLGQGEVFVNGQSKLTSLNKNSMSFNKGLTRNASHSDTDGQRTRIGVQKGSTLMKALDKVVRNNNNNNHDLLKKQRRDSISNIIKDNPNGVSIKDIVSAIHNQGQEIGEKTIQRELISMVKDNVLKKTGEKRWSQYFLQ